MVSLWSAGASFLDEGTLKEFQSEDYSRFVKVVREKYDIEPDDDTQPTDSVVNHIFKVAYAFIAARAQQSLDEGLSAQNDVPGTLGILEFVETNLEWAEATVNQVLLPAKAASLLNYIILGRFIGPSQQLGLGEIEASVTQLFKRKRGRPSAHVFNDFVRGRAAEGYSDTEIAAEWQDRYPDEYLGKDGDPAQKTLWRVQKQRRRRS